MSEPSHQELDSQLSARKKAPEVYSKLPKWLVDLALELEGMFGMIWRFFREVFVPPYEFREVLRQCYLIGYKTLLLITFIAYIAGIVFTKQSRPSLVSFGAESWLPALVSIAFVRSLGPLITSLVSAGKIGSNIAAELGSMRVSEQIDAMEVSGTNPFKFLVVSRILATTFMIPTLVIYSDFMGLMGSFTSVNGFSGTSFSLFFDQVFEAIVMEDVFYSIGKSIFFGFAIGVISCYKGYTAKNGTVGVGKGANSAVVISMLLVFILDLVALQIQTIFGFNPR
jgi:phospholipid/cholesterol/gamma-HCH transport system permease protein